MLKRQRAKQLPTEPVEYPAGSYISTERGYFYIFDSSKRYRIVSRRVLDSWHPHRVIKTTEAAVQKYRVAAKLKFRNGSLIHNIADAKMYLIVNGQKRHITSPSVFEEIGAHPRECVTVSDSEIKLHEEGDPLN